ncbi:MAG: hypothetical protein AAF202_05965, partial [Pseudomonadota bacterium]
MLKVQDNGSSILVLAKKKGMTWLQVGPNRHQINVVPSDQLGFYQRVVAILERFKGLKANLHHENGVTITGILLRISDWQQIAKLAMERKQKFTMKAKLHPLAMKDANQWVSDISKEVGVASNQFVLHPEAQFHHIATTRENQDTILQQISMYGFTIISDSRRVAQLPSVQLEVVIAEVDKTFERELGLRWGDSGRYSTQVLPEAKWSVLSAELSALESRGSGQILAKPRLLSRSGERAEFHAGGEIPIRIAGWGTQNVQWKKHGIILTFQPQADHLGAMKLQVEIEISIPNLSQMVGQLPTFETNRVKSQFDLSKK